MADSEPQHYHEFVLPGEVLHAGRNASNDIKLLNDKISNWNHIRIEVLNEKECWIISEKHQYVYEGRIKKEGIVKNGGCMELISDELLPSVVILSEGDKGHPEYEAVKKRWWRTSVREKIYSKQYDGKGNAAPVPTQLPETQPMDLFLLNNEKSSEPIQLPETQPMDLFLLNNEESFESIQLPETQLMDLLSLNNVNEESFAAIPLTETQPMEVEDNQRQLRTKDLIASMVPTMLNSRGFNTRTVTMEYLGISANYGIRRTNIERHVNRITGLDRIMNVVDELESLEDYLERISEVAERDQLFEKNNGETRCNMFGQHVISNIACIDPSCTKLQARKTSTMKGLSKHLVQDHWNLLFLNGEPRVIQLRKDNRAVNYAVCCWCRNIISDNNNVHMVDHFNQAMRNNLTFKTSWYHVAILTGLYLVNNQPKEVLLRIKRLHYETVIRAANDDNAECVADFVQFVKSHPHVQGYIDEFVWHTGINGVGGVGQVNYKSIQAYSYVNTPEKRSYNGETNRKMNKRMSPGEAKRHGKNGILNQVATVCVTYGHFEFPPTENLENHKHKARGVESVISKYWARLGYTVENRNSTEKVERCRLEMNEPLVPNTTNRCLIVEQPWASLIFKNVMNVISKHRPTTHRGTIYIKSSPKPPTESDLALASAKYPDIDLSTLPANQILGRVNIVDVKTKVAYSAQFKNSDCRLCYAWLYDSVEELQTPIEDDTNRTLLHYLSSPVLKKLQISKYK